MHKSFLRSICYSLSGRTTKLPRCPNLYQKRLRRIIVYKIFSFVGITNALINILGYYLYTFHLKLETTKHPFAKDVCFQFVFLVAIYFQLRLYYC